MGNRDEWFDTDHIDVDGVRYCPYCGKRIEAREDYDIYSPVTYWKCNCSSALKAHELKEQIHALEMKMPRKKYMAAMAIKKIE